MIRVAVGCAPNHDDIESQAVLEWSIRKHASAPVEITWMKLSRDPDNLFYSNGMEGWRTDRWATPFTGFRWAVPALYGFEGRAIYTDSDVIFKDDIAKLWEQEIPPGKIVLAKGGNSWRFCVSCWDCKAAKPHTLPLNDLRSDPGAHSQMTRVVKPLVQSFRGDWNNLDGEGYPNLDDPKLKALHYTSMPHQPHLAYAIPRLTKEGRRHWFDGKVQSHWRPDLKALFDRMLTEAKANGYPPERYIDTPLYGEIRKQSLRGHHGRVTR
jgi:hypothetical protein